MIVQYLYWLKIDDNVSFDFEWLDDKTKSYRHNKVLNELILDDARKTLLFQIDIMSNLGLNLHLKPSSYSSVLWSRKRTLNITTAKHAKQCPITFIFRRIR